MNIRYKMSKGSETKWVYYGEIEKYVAMGWEKVLDPDTGEHICTSC